MPVVVDEYVWPRLTALASSAKRAHVAVAYIGADADQLLKLRSGSVLVADCTEAAAKAGQVNPDALAAYIQGGVNVFRHPGLHAKVFVFDDTAVIGSANISTSSQGLVEAAIITTAKSDVAAARAFVESLAQEPVDDDILEALRSAWRPPVFKPKRARPRLRWHPIPDHNEWSLWCINTVETDFPAYVQTKVDARHRTVRRLATTANFKLETILWDAKPPFRADDVLIERWRDEDGRDRVSPPARVERIWAVQRGGRKRILVTLQRSTTMHARAGASLVKAAESSGLRLRNDVWTQCIGKVPQRDALLAVWGITPDHPRIETD